MILKQDSETGWWVVSKANPSVRLTNLHDVSSCGEYCDVHNRRHPAEVEYPLNWRDDRGIMEYICPCGIGHPTYAQKAYNRSRGREYENIHGCCRVHC